MRPQRLAVDANVSYRDKQPLRLSCTSLSKVASDSIASFLSIVSSNPFLSERIKRHNIISSPLYIDLLCVGEKGAGLPCVSLPHDVHALFSWTTSALEHIRYRRSLHLHAHGLGFSRRFHTSIFLYLTFRVGVSVQRLACCISTCLRSIVVAS